MKPYYLSGNIKPLKVAGLNFQIHTGKKPDKTEELMQKAIGNHRHFYPDGEDLFYISQAKLWANISQEGSLFVKGLYPLTLSTPLSVQSEVENDIKQYASTIAVKMKYFGIDTLQYRGANVTCGNVFFDDGMTIIEKYAVINDLRYLLTEIFVSRPETSWKYNLSKSPEENLALIRLSQSHVVYINNKKDLPNKVTFFDGQVVLEKNSGYMLVKKFPIWMSEASLTNLAKSFLKNSLEKLPEKAA